MGLGPLHSRIAIDPPAILECAKVEFHTPKITIDKDHILKGG